MQINPAARPIGQVLPVMHVLYRCPRTSMRVQAWLAKEVSSMATTQDYELVSCPACTQQHLINRATGKLLGDNKQ